MPRDSQETVFCVTAILLNTGHRAIPRRVPVSPSDAAQNRQMKALLRRLALKSCVPRLSRGSLHSHKWAAGAGPPRMPSEALSFTVSQACLNRHINPPDTWNFLVNQVEVNFPIQTRASLTFARYHRPISSSSFFNIFTAET